MSLPRGIQGIANKIDRFLPCTSWDLKIFREYNASAGMTKQKLADHFRITKADVTRLFRRRRNDLKLSLSLDELVTICKKRGLARRFADIIGCPQHLLVDLRNEKAKKAVREITRGPQKTTVTEILSR